ncbi:uncharacterized protein LOC1279946 [Anopheles gambiae]|uniref:uncharacterized protein LOC1279946 n=1 Tax=Anopheles gambiae TaxID=7165 RepID=UPI002AC8BF16|nr:uncharacterized protein LOC1279946 [Anopheles gambiae]
MNHNNPLPPLWQVATTTSGHQPRMNSSAGSSTGKLTAGSISSVKYVSNARPTMKIINIPNQQQASMTATSDGTLLYGTSIGGAGSYLTVTNDQRQMQPPPQVRRPVTTTTTTTHAALLNESILLQTPDGREYLVDERSIQNIDQIPPENLIYMTASEALSVVDADDVGQLAIVDESQLALHDYVVPAEAAIDQTQHQVQDQPATSVEAQQYAEECEVTEEVITDDWVQPQGEECVQVTVDQLGVSAVVVQEEDDISVPLDQDQYTLSRPYPCDFCSRRFRKKSSLQNHLMAHSNDRPHCCNLCGAQYSHRADLINHLKQHAYSVAEQDELALRSDQEAEYDLPDLGHSSSGGGGHSMKHRLRHSSDDEDMYIQNSMVSYNSQPPMQLISTTHYGASSSSTIGSSSYAHDVPMEQSPYLESVPPVLEQKYTLGKMDPSGPATLSNTTGKRTPRKKQSQSTQDTRTARTKPVFASKVGSRQIKKEPLEHGEGGNAISSPPPTRTVAADWRKPFVCQQCGASFAREKALLSHARTHAGSTRYDCALCNAHFWEQSLLRDHVQRAHPAQEAWVADHEPYGSAHGAIELPVVTTTTTTKQYNCDSCSAVFFQLDHLLNHTHHAHGTFEQHQQSSSNRSVLVKQELLQTSSKVELESDREAEATDQEAIEEDEEEEGEEYDNLEYTIEHYEQAPPPPQRSNEPDQSALTCRDCGESFDSAMDLLDHSEVHGGGAAQYEPLECQLCGEKFPDEANIKQHVQDRHRDELTATSCAICGKRCKSQTTLMKHAWDHSRERAHSCSKCGKTFHHMTRLKRHMDSHRNKAVRCEVCKEEFPDGRTLMNHRHSHTKSNEYPCHECGKTFGSRSSQQIHMRIHTGERPYACRFCWKAFADGGTLRKHERIHTGEKPYACPVCPKAFNQRVVLREHIRAHHSQADAKRGSPDQPYYCTVCSSPFGTTADLVQHLIEHSDTNTAMKRKPPTFPRKYKRRRKLKPHELERLQSGRRKQKSKRQMDNEEEEEEEEEDDDDGSGGSGNQFEDGTTARTTDRTVVERARGDGKPTGSSFVRYHPDGTRKASTREMYLEYDDMGGGSVTHAPKASSQGMLDVNGINLLSNVVLLHGQQEEPSHAHNNNHLPESPPRHMFGELPKAKQQPPGSSRMIYTQKSTTKAAPASSRKTPSARKRPAAKEQRPAAAPPPPVKLEPDEDDPAIAMEALFRGRKRNASLLPEIPPHRISSVGFPLLDDGNTDDPMDEPEQRARRSTASFSASEDDLLSQQLLMEISHKSKYTERFNSDTLNDLEEILRSPVKGAGSPAVAKRATTVPSTSATGKKQQQSAAAAKKPTSQRKRTAAPKAKAAAKGKNKPAASSTASGAGSSSSRQPPQKPVEKRAAREPPAVLRSQRLTRRQLEREVNFLKEAYDAGEPVHEATADGSGGSSSVAVVKTEAVDKRSLLDGAATGVTEALDRPDSSERLAAMLLNDGLPDESDSSNSSGEGSRRSSVMSTAARQTHKYGPESYAEELQMMETAEEEHVVKQEDDQGQGEHHYELGDDDVGELYLDDNDTTTSATTPAAAIGDEPLHRCSICCACFDDRAQLILHVPVHI